MVWLVVVVSAVVVGCTPGQYAKQADRAAYAIVASGQRSAIGKAGPFSVEYSPFPVEKNSPAVIRVGKKIISISAGPEQILTAYECLEIALRNSRSFQTRKEELFVSALSLANAHRGWTRPLLEGEAAGNAECARTDKPGQWDNAADAETGASLTQRFRDGAVLTLATTVGLASDLLGSDGTTVGSLVEANITQPLLRGAWRQLAYEDQYRLERDFLFDVFGYERFIQTFAVDIVNKYYLVLQLRDRLENEQANITRLKQTLALTRVQVEGGQVSRIQQDQAEQKLLDAQIRYQRNQQNYRNSLDSFKLELGIPIAAAVGVDYPGVLEGLNKVGLKPVPFKESEAVAVALSTRPDVLTERAGVRDAERDVEIAADDFLPQLDVTLGYSAEGGTHRHDFWSVRFDRHRRSAMIDFAWSLDQTDNRDAYRNAIIAFERVKRDCAEFVDRVRLEVRESYRTLLRSRRSYELQLRNVQIARRRRKLASLQQKEGQASVRDVLEAEEALREAQNGLTGALIDYTTTRLEFLANLGMIRVDGKGILHERAEPFKFERIERRYPCAVSR